MKAFRFHRHGGPEVLQLEDVAVAEPGRGELRIRNTAIAVNFRDVLVRRGTHAVKSFPSGIGVESAGVIEAVGPDVSGLRGRPARRVRGRVRMRAYAEQRIIPAARAIVLPAGIDERTAAAMMIRGMTARYLLRETYRVQAGRHDPDPCRRRRRRADRVPMGQAPGRDRDRHGRQRGEGGARAGAWLRPSDRLRGLRRARARDHGRGGRAGGLRFRRQGHVRGIAALPLRRRGILASFGEASGDPDPVPPRRLGQLGSLYRDAPEPRRLHRDAGGDCWRPPTTCSTWS